MSRKNGDDDGKKPKFSRWVNEHSKALGKLFEYKQADPQRLDTAYIDSLWEEFQEDEDSIFNGIQKMRFRSHYKEKAAIWLTGEAMKGRRRRKMVLAFDFV